MAQWSVAHTREMTAWVSAMPPWPVPYAGQSLASYKEVLKWHEKRLEEWDAKEPKEVSNAVV